MLNVAFLGARLMAGQQTLNLLVEVRILCPQLYNCSLERVSNLFKSRFSSHRGSMSFSLRLNLLERASGFFNSISHFLLEIKSFSQN